MQADEKWRVLARGIRLFVRVLADGVGQDGEFSEEMERWAEQEARSVAAELDRQLGQAGQFSEGIGRAEPEARSLVADLDRHSGADVWRELVPGMSWTEVFRILADIPPNHVFRLRRRGEGMVLESVCDPSLAEQFERVANGNPA